MTHYWTTVLHVCKQSSSSSSSLPVLRKSTCSSDTKTGSCHWQRCNSRSKSSLRNKKRNPLLQHSRYNSHKYNTWDFALAKVLDLASVVVLYEKQSQLARPKHNSLVSVDLVVDVDVGVRSTVVGAGLGIGDGIGDGIDDGIDDGVGDGV
jgi:hypothetical protein